MALPDRPGVLCQDEEGRLEGILRILLVVQHPPTDAQNHRSVAAEQGGKGSLIMAGAEIIQKLPVGQLRRAATGRQFADVPKNRFELCRGHVRNPPISGSLLYSSRWQGSRSRILEKCQRGCHVAVRNEVGKDLPTIAIELVSEARRDHLRDYEEKRREYMKLGIGEYWIIDRFRRIMSVIRDRPKGPQVRIIHEQEIFRALAPRLRIDLWPGRWR